MADARWSTKDAILRRALEVALPLHRAIVLPALLLKFHTNPVTSLEGRRAYEADDADSVVVELDLLSYGQRRAAHFASFLVCYDRCSNRFDRSNVLRGSGAALLILCSLM